MSTRKKTSGGQAIVMVTVALVAMCGMIGLAVDLGWSFFVKKQAQTAADSAALGAVQEAYRRLTSSGAIISAFTCPGSPGTTSAWCQPQGVGNSAADCKNIDTNSNLQSGCLYAKSSTSNGFDYTNASSRQKVWMQANDASTLPNQPATPSGQPLGVNQLVYWVTATTVQTIPQLFSSVMGNTQGTVSALATAAIASSIVKGSFYGMDHQGDCSTDSTGAFQECGVDIDAKGNGGACSGQAGVYLCAPAGVILSSTCHSATQIANECTGTGFAGAGGKVYGGPGIFVNTNGANGIKTGDLANWNPTPVSAGPIAYTDPTAPNPQPPIAAGTNPIASCGYPGGVIPAASGKNATTTLGPFQFYSYRVVAGVKVPDGKPIVLPANATFDPQANTQALGCPDGGAPAVNGIWQGGTGQSTNSAFPTYILWGGIDGTSGKPNVNFGAGQYILAGTDGSNTISSGANGANVLSNFGGTITGNNTVGTMFILTDTNYVGGGTANPTSLSQQISNIPNYTSASQTLTSLKMGSIDLKDATVTLNGYNKANLGTPLTNMDAYDGILIWQDRRNSTLEYNKAPTAACTSPECTKDDGTVVSDGLGPAGCKNCATLAQRLENNVTPTSPGLSVDDGNGIKTLKGVIYQPRGAWFLMNPGTGSVNNSPLQIITGQLICGTACGNTQVTLTSPAIPFLRYVATLIQ